MPSNTVQRVVRELRADGEAEHADLGVGTADVADLGARPGAAPCAG